MRPLNHVSHIVIHGSWTTPEQDIGVEDIREWHLDRGFSDIGYHYVIRRDGELEEGRSVENQGAHVYGRNDYTLGICLVGGRPERPAADGNWEFNYTFAQMMTLTSLIQDAFRNEHILPNPELEARPGTVRGHRDFPEVLKRCPGFDVQAFYDDLVFSTLG